MTKPPSRFEGPLERVDANCWRIPKAYKTGMNVDGLVYANDSLIETIRHDQALEQVANVAFLPGIQYASLAMPDIHWGYGFCIGGVCATDPEAGGVISPGGVGYDINCGVRLVRTNLTRQEVAPRAGKLTDVLFNNIPTGVGRGGKYRFNHDELRILMRLGPQALIDQGLATERDIEFTEARGKLDDARPDYVSQRAMDRGSDQCGSLGSGNHFLEIQYVDRIFDEPSAQAMGLSKDGICAMIHSGSRGLGYQVCDDALRALRGVPEKYGIQLPDRQLACAPVNSSEGSKYLGAMRAAANFAWCNRQLLMWQTREVFESVFKRTWEAMDMQLVYDVAHNIAKFETHVVDGNEKALWVHRKGATRAFPPNHRELPALYASIGQPVLIPGDMGRASWVLVGQSASMLKTFGSACHGAGRMLSRRAAIRAAEGRHIGDELSKKGIVARARSWKGLAEEQPAAYKDVDVVVDVVAQAGIAKKVARLRPLGVIKG